MDEARGHESAVIAPNPGDVKPLRTHHPDRSSQVSLFDFPPALPRRPRSADRTWSPAAVSKKREFFKYPPETIGYFAPEPIKFGVWIDTTNLRKPAIGGPFWHC
jgi:hypothetical protein